jgi:hypothetical protein
MNLKKLLAISLLFNLFTFSALLYSHSRAPAPVPAAGEALAGTRSAAPTQQKVPFTRTVVQEFDWRMVESEDYRQYIENLRAIGCPEETIQDIIIADVNKLFDMRRLELLPSEADDFQFWKTGASLFASPNSEGLHAEMQQLREMAEEKQGFIKELLGVDVPGHQPLTPATLDFQERILAFLPPEQRRQIADIEQKYAALRMAELSQTGPPGSNAARLQQLDREKELALAAVLEPAQFDEYLLRTSPLADTLRMQLHGFEPTPEEFRAIFKARKTFEDEFGSLHGIASSPHPVEKRAHAQLSMEEELEQLLGRQRYMEMHRQQDWGYRGALEVAQQNGLPNEIAKEVYNIKITAEEQSRFLQVDTSLTPAERQAALVQMQQQVEEELAVTLGRDAYGAYRSQPGAAWIFHLNPRSR